MPSRTRNVSAAGRVTFFWMYFRWTSIEGCPQAPCQFWNTWAWQSMIIQDTRPRTGLDTKGPERYAAPSFSM
jgi:hypothetical protein